MQFKQSQVVADDSTTSLEPSEEGKVRQRAVWLVRPDESHLYTEEMFRAILDEVDRANEVGVATRMGWSEVVDGARNLLMPDLIMNDKPLYLESNWQAYVVRPPAGMFASERISAVAVMAYHSQEQIIGLYVMSEPLIDCPTEWYDIAITLLLKRYFNIDWVSPDQIMRQMDVLANGRNVGVAGDIHIS